MRIPPLKWLVRKILVHRNKSRKQTRILPLDSIRHAVVLVDAGEDGYESAVDEVNSFFHGEGIDVLVVKAGPKEIIWPGILSKRVRFSGKEKDGGGLFVNLFGHPGLMSEYESVCSTADFKIGREQLRGDVFDIVVTNPQAAVPSQKEVFVAIEDILKKIKK